MLHRCGFHTEAVMGEWLSTCVFGGGWGDSKGQTDRPRLAELLRGEESKELWENRSFVKRPGASRDIAVSQILSLTVFFVLLC